jgi:CPA2 family monovalent cation:H+ antiporter-2
MPHETELITTISIALVVAFLGGFVATRLRMPPIVGYLLAGVVIGPFTPGFVGDPQIASQLADLGVILLMFGVGIHFSVRDLLAVRSIAVPGALAQIAIATALTMGVAVWWWGWSAGEGLVLGLAISVASTVVLLRALMEQGTLDSSPGRVAVGWLIVEDLFTVVVLVLLPILAAPLGGKPPAGAMSAPGGASAMVALAFALGKVAVFAVLMYFVGRRVVPWLLVQVARSGSRELFTLAVLATALGIALASATLFGVSLALGAFLAGLVVGESDQSHQAAADALPLRDAFAVLFFVSVGMLFDPASLLEAPGLLLVVLAIILLGKTVAAFLVVVTLGHPIRTALVVSAGLAQIGEFSFILGELGHSLGLLPQEGQNLIIAGALFSITLNPLLFRAIAPAEAWLRAHPRLAAVLERRAEQTPSPPPGAGDRGLQAHAVVCGYGRVGSIIGEALLRHGFPYVVVEQDQRKAEQLSHQGIPVLWGDASNRTILEHAGLGEAQLLIVATGDWLTDRRIVEYARHKTPDLQIVVRTHRWNEFDIMQQLGVGEAVMGEVELALEMSRFALRAFGVDEAAVAETVRSTRAHAVMNWHEVIPEVTSE